MSPCQLLRALAERHITIVGDHGHPALDDPGHHLADQLLNAARQHRWLLAWAVAGQRSGHGWAACDRCDEPALLRLDDRRTSRSCLITPGCPGRHRPTPKEKK